jgi:hypothetical protein
MNSEFVFVRKDGVSPPLAQPYDGPYKVIRHSLHSFQLQIGSRAEEVSTHRLKVCHAPPDTAVALPPKRGRPPNRPPPPPSDGAKSPNQNPGEPTSTKKLAGHRGRPLSSAGCFPSTAEKTARKNQAVAGARPTPLKKQTGGPRVADAHINPALPTQMREGPVQLSGCLFPVRSTLYPRFFQDTPPAQTAFRIQC